MAQASRTTGTYTAHTLATAANVETDVNNLFTVHNNHDSGSSVWTVMSCTLAKIADGTVGSPSLTFVNGLTDGIYRIGTNNFGFSTNGTKRLDISTTAITSALPIAMGTNKITGLGDGSSAQDAVTFNQLKSNNIVGTTTNDSATAGNIGQYIEGIASSVAAASSATISDATSISLTAGDWDVTGMGYFSGGSGYTVWQLGISSTSGNSTTGLTLGVNRFLTDLTSGVSLEQCLFVPNYRVSISSTTIYYLKFSQSYTGGSPTISGRLSARRVR